MSVTLLGGVKIPLIGLGTSQANNEEEFENALEAALEIGYRFIDTAAMYRNEHIVGKVLNKWFTSGKLKREDIFITSKLPMTHVHPDFVEAALKESLQKLQLDYVDLYLVHFPIRMNSIQLGKPMEPLPTDHVAVWKKMEEQVDAKRTRTIGISNFGIHQIDRILQNARIPPASTQVELHVYFQQKELRAFCKKHNIAVGSYGSLGSPGRKVTDSELTHDLLGDPVVTKIAQKHKKTSGQVLLRYLTQKNIVVNPKSVKRDRLKENFDILSFTLDSGDLKALENLDKGEEGRTFKFEKLNPSLKDHPEWPHKK